MTQQESIRHWQQGARDSLRAAELLYDDKKYSLTLFHCHLAIEKALKALYITEHDGAAPYIHNLIDLTHSLSREFTNEQHRFLRELTRFAVDARYNDPVWAETQATPEVVEKWLEQTQSLLSILL